MDQPYGWQTSETNGLNGTIQEVGGAPWGMERYNASVTLSWSGQSPVSVFACDENGYATDKPVASERTDGQVFIPIEQTTAYTIITR